MGDPGRVAGKTPADIGTDSHSTTHTHKAKKIAKIDREVPTKHFCGHTYTNKPPITHKDMLYLYCSQQNNKQLQEKCCLLLQQEGERLRKLRSETANIDKLGAAKRINPPIKTHI